MVSSRTLEGELESWFLVSRAIIMELVRDVCSFEMNLLNCIWCDGKVVSWKKIGVGF